MTRGEATRCAAAIVAAHTPDLVALCLILDTAGLGRLSAALRALGGDAKPPVARGSPDAELWDRQADRVIGRNE